jgi:hypothetical protein
LIREKEYRKYEAEMSKLAEMEGSKPYGMTDTEGEEFHDIPESEKGFYVPTVKVSKFSTGGDVTC